MKTRLIVKICAMAAMLGFAGASLAATLVVEQHNKTFVNHGNKVEKLQIKKGDVIRFQNEDPFFHNIFSLSDLKTFDLGSFPKGEFKEVVFDKPGVVEVECAIHPEMYMEVTVLE